MSPISRTQPISETVKWIRNVLDNNITDPISEDRGKKERFVMTSYPSREVKYPIITITQKGLDSRSLGMQSETQLYTMRIEVRIWAKDEKQRDTLGEQAITFLKNYQKDTLGSDNQNLYGFRVLSAVNVDDPDAPHPKSKVLEIQYLFIS